LQLNNAEYCGCKRRYVVVIGSFVVVNISVGVVNGYVVVV